LFSRGTFAPIWPYFETSLIIYVHKYAIVVNSPSEFFFGMIPTRKMTKKSPRTQEDAVWDRKIGAALAFIRNRDAQQTQAVFAERIGISRSLLANVESGRTPLISSLGWKFCREFDCHPSWLCTAGNSWHPNVFPEIDDDKLAKIEKVIHAGATLPFRNVWPSLAWLIGADTEHGEKSQLTNKASSLTSEVVKPVLPKLIERLKRATATRGKKSALAEWLGVHRQCVTDWLSGKQEPGGEITLRLLQWVEQQERQK
jgi:DNA-binding transcriptional regulator YiaG